MKFYFFFRFQNIIRIHNNRVIIQKFFALFINHHDIRIDHNLFKTVKDIRLHISRITYITINHTIFLFKHFFIPPILFVNAFLPEPDGNVP